MNYDDWKGATPYGDDDNAGECTGCGAATDGKPLCDDCRAQEQLEIEDGAR